MGDRIAGTFGSRLGRAALAGILTVSFAGGTTLAQSYQPIGTGFSWGRLNVFPSVAMDYGYDSNIFYASEDITTSLGIVSSRELRIQPRVLFDLPRGNSWVRWAYAPTFRNYSTDAYTPTKPWTQNFNLDGTLRLGSRFYTTFRDQFLLGTEELQSVDPGGEVNFGDVPFRQHTPLVEVGCDLGARQGASVVWNYNSVQFEEDDSAISNYRGHGLQARYNYSMSDATKAFVYAGTDDTQQNRITPVVEIVDVETRSVGFGLNQTVNRAVTTSVTLGYQAIDYSGGSLNEYRGPVLSAQASWLLSDVTRLSFLVRRQPYSSFYLNNNYYLNRTIGLDLTHQAGTAWYWRVGGGFDNNTYSDPLDVSGFQSVYCVLDPPNAPVCPSDGAIRRDRSWRVEGGVGGQASRSLRWFVGYNAQGRSSNILQADVQGFGDPFAYDIHRLYLRIEVGLL